MRRALVHAASVFAAIATAALASFLVLAAADRVGSAENHCAAGKRDGVGSVTDKDAGNVRQTLHN